MEMYKQASKQKLRFSTTKGLLTVEQLWSLSLTDLDTLAVSLQDAYDKSKGAKSFLSTKTDEDKTVKLMFDICLDILQTKVDEKEVANKARETREHNQKILALMAEKKDEQLKGMSLEELEKQLK